MIKFKTRTQWTLFGFFLKNKKKILYKLRKIHKIYQFFVAFEETFVDSFCQKGVS